LAARPSAAASQAADTTTKAHIANFQGFRSNPAAAKTAETAIPPMRAFVEVTAENKTKSWRGA
jgi:hypothetical protein